MSEGSTETSEYSSSSSEDSFQETATSQKLQQKKTDSKPISSPTDLPMHEIKHITELTFTPRQLLKNFSKNNGAVTINTKDGSLGFNGGDYEPDFLLLEKAMADHEALSNNNNNNNNNNTMALGSKKPKKKKKSSKCGMMGTDLPSESHYSDIVQSVDAENVTTTWSRSLQISLDTVPKFQKEAFPGGSRVVTKRFLPGELSTTAKNFNLCKRTVTHGSIKFHDEHIGTTPTSLEKGISRNYEKKYAIMDVGSPVIGYYNRDHPDKKITGPSKGLEIHDQVKMSLELAEHYIKTTKDDMKNKISYGNVTDDCQMTLSVPCPPNRLKAHKLWLATDGKEGKQFKGFCDAEYALPDVDVKAIASNGKTHEENFLDTPIHFNAGFVSKYRHCHGKAFLSSK